MATRLGRTLPARGADCTEPGWLRHRRAEPRGVVIDDDRTWVTQLTHPAAELDTGKAVLTLRARANEPPTVVPADQWRYEADGAAVTLLPEGTKFKPGTLYELVYPAKKPKVAGLGFAATRDLAAFLRYAKADDAGHANPLAGPTRQVYTICVS